MNKTGFYLCLCQAGSRRDYLLLQMNRMFKAASIRGHIQHRTPSCARTRPAGTTGRAGVGAPTRPLEARQSPLGVNKSPQHSCFPQSCLGEVVPHGLPWASGNCLWILTWMSETPEFYLQTR